MWGFGAKDRGDWGSQGLPCLAQGGPEGIPWGLQGQVGAGPAAYALPSGQLCSPGLQMRRPGGRSVPRFCPAGPVGVWALGVSPSGLPCEGPVASCHGGAAGGTSQADRRAREQRP